MDWWTIGIFAMLGVVGLLVGIRFFSEVL